MPVTSLRHCQHCSDGRGSLGPSADHASNHKHNVCQPQPLQTSCYTQLLTVQTSQSQTADSAPAAANREAKRPKSSPVRPSACDWYYCAQFTAKPKAACALRFSWAATSSNLGLRATPSKHDVIHKTISTRRTTTPPEQGRATANDNTHEKFGEDRKYSSEDTIADRQTQTDRHTRHDTRLPYRGLSNRRAQ